MSKADKQREHAHQDVEVRIAATPAQLSVVRAVAGDIAMHEHFDMDSVEDLRLAVDEACSLLVQLALPATTMVCRFLALPEEIRVSGTVAGQDGGELSDNTFSWRVLSAVSDSVDAWISPSPGHTGGQTVQIELTRQRA